MSNSRNNNDFRPQRGHHYGQNRPYQGDQYRPLQNDQYRPYQADQNRPYQADQNRLLQNDQYRPYQDEQNRPLQNDQYRPLQADQNRPYQGDQNRPLQADQNRPYQGEQGRPYQGEQGRPYRPFNNNRYYEQEDERRKRSFAIIGLRPLLGTPTFRESQVEDYNAAIDICRYLGINDNVQIQHVKRARTGAVVIVELETIESRNLLLGRKHHLSRNEETRYLRLEKAFTREEIANRYGQPGERTDSTAESN
uniref:Uncharacterized protein n=1 Tax=Panagrolaimus sp. PS1159 TaxID=55785 RepID=A0AC35F7J8_9BILA